MTLTDTIEHLARREAQDQYVTAIRAIRALGDLFDFSDDVAEEAALDAFQAGRAAFWITCQGIPHPSVFPHLRALLLTVNRDGLAEAIRRHGPDTPSLIKSRMVPLNRQAAAELYRSHIIADEYERAALGRQAGEEVE